MPQSELHTLVLNTLRDLRRDLDQQMANLSQGQTTQAEAFKTLEVRQAATLKALRQLESRQAESEQVLASLSELYKTLPPLIDSINNAVRNAPL